MVAIVLVSLVGSWRLRGYGNVRLREGLIIGALSPVGVLVGVGLANSVPERALELSFAGVQLVFAWQLAKKAGLRQLHAGGDPRCQERGPERARAPRPGG